MGGATSPGFCPPGPRIPRPKLRIEPVVRELRRELVSDVPLDGVERVDIVLAGESEGFAFGTDAGGAADAVDVILRILREVVVDDVAHALEVEAAAGEFSRLAEGVQGLRHAVPLALSQQDWGDGHPVRLGVRHYLSEDGEGWARVANSRLTGLWKEEAR